MSDTIDYGTLMHNAMRSLIRRVLGDVSQHGLPGEHHFFITFDTRHPDAELADWLRERYPSEMTIVIQHWFEGLEVTKDGFSVTLNFGEAPEPLSIPYDAIKTFVDPSVEFGLRFETQDEDDEDDEDTLSLVDKEDDDETSKADADEKPAHKDAEIVSLDSFRR